MKGFVIYILLFFCLGCRVNQAPGFWIESRNVISEENTKSIVPDKYKIFQLDSAKFNKALEEVGNSQLTSNSILLPNPDGKTQKFLIWKSNTINEGLLAKFPHLQTYQGISTQSDTIKIRIEKSNSGFQFMVIDGENTWFATPLKELPTDYLFYYKQDLPNGSKQSSYY